MTQDNTRIYDVVIVGIFARFKTVCYDGQVKNLSHLKISLLWVRINSSHHAGNVRRQLHFCIQTDRIVGQGVCSGGVCKHPIASQTTSNPITLISGAAASFISAGDTGTYGVRGVILSIGRNAQVTAMIVVITLTGEVTSQVIIANTEGDIF